MKKRKRTVHMKTFKKILHNNFDMNMHTRTRERNTSKRNYPNNGWLFFPLPISPPPPIKNILKEIKLKMQREKMAW